MSQQAQRLRRVGKPRATVRADLNARDAAIYARRFGGRIAAQAAR